MADKSPDFEIGEYANTPNCHIDSVELSGALTAAEAGLPLKATGVNSAGLLKVEKATGATDQAVCVSIQNQYGAVGDIIGALFQGIVKVKFGGDVAAGGVVHSAASKFVKTGGSTKSLGYSRVVAAADGDTGLIYFRGP